MNDIASKSHQIESKKLDKIEHGSYISKLYQKTIGNGNINKVKHQRNLRVFDQFGKFTVSAAINVENVINKLRSFKYEIEEIKFTISQMDRAQTLQVDLHLGILKNGLEALQKYKKRLDGRITESNKNQVQIPV